MFGCSVGVFCVSLVVGFDIVLGFGVWFLCFLGLVFAWTEVLGG